VRGHSEVPVSLSFFLNPPLLVEGSETFYRSGVNIFLFIFFARPKHTSSNKANCHHEGHEDHEGIYEFFCFVYFVVQKNWILLAFYNSAMLDLVAGLLPADPNHWLGSREAIWIQTACLPG
jgi:hypothetical protein